MTLAEKCAERKLANIAKRKDMAIAQAQRNREMNSVLRQKIERDHQDTKQSGDNNG